MLYVSLSRPFNHKIVALPTASQDSENPHQRRTKASIGLVNIVDIILSQSLSSTELGKAYLFDEQRPLKTLKSANNTFRARPYLQNEGTVKDAKQQQAKC